MADDERPTLGDAPPQGRPFSTMPDRPPLRQVANDPNAAATRVAIAARTQARRDAVIAVTRARERGGINAATWSGAEIDILHAITDLLLEIQAPALRPTIGTEDQPYKA
jgi:hypothetical protein